MEDSKTIKGFWWRPGDPDTRWFGILEQSGSDIELTCYSDTGPIPLVDGKPGATVYGRNEKGLPVTLLVVSQLGKSQSGGMHTVRLGVGYVLLGIHVTDRESFKVKAADLRMQQLYGWLGLTGFNRQMNATRSANVAITYDRQSRQSHLVGSCGDKVCFGLETNQSVQFQSQKIEEEATVSFESDAGIDFQKVWALTTAMRTLLHFAILKPVHTVTMGLRDVTCSSEGESTSVKGVEVWSKNFREPKTELPIDSLWVFRFADFADSVEKVLSNWLEYQAKYEEALGCYTTTIYSNLTSPVKNLCLTQALDAYHGVRFGSHAERGFKKKLEELCSLSKTALAGLVDDIPSFAEQAKDTRDYFTHHNPEDLKRNVVTGTAEVIRLNEKLTILFQSLVLMDIGVSEDRLIRLRRQIATEIVAY